MEKHNFFLYHLDNELQKLFALKTYNHRVLLENFNLIIKLAFLLCNDTLYIPASNYFESDLSFNSLNNFKELSEIGAIQLVSSSYNLDEFLERKVNQFKGEILFENYHYSDFLNIENEIVLPGQMKKRDGSASKDIKEGWQKRINNKSFTENLYRYSSVSASKFEDALYEMPQKLGDRAYISDLIVPLLPIEKKYLSDFNNIINTFVTNEYIKSFLNEFNAYCFKDLPIIDDSLFLYDIDGSKLISYKSVVVWGIKKKYKNNCHLYDYIKQCNSYELIELKYSPLGQLLIEDFYDNNLLTSKEYNKISKTNIVNVRSKEGNDMEHVLIISALEKEIRPIISILNSYINEYSKDEFEGEVYYTFSISNELKITCTTFIGMGQINAALAVTKAINHYRITKVVLTGICGGINDQIKIGDLIISEQIVDYEIGKITSDKDQHRWQVYRSDYSLAHSLKNFKSDKWLSELNSLFPDKLIDTPMTHLGIVLSGNKVMADVESVNMLKNTWSQALAIEMEASGIASAIYHQENPPSFVMVKSVCDLADNKKNDDWHEFSSYAAALFILDYFLQDDYILPQNDQSLIINEKQNIELLSVLKGTYDMSELNVLAFKIGIDIDDIKGDIKSEKIVELIKYCNRKKITNKLIEQINADRNNILNKKYTLKHNP